MEAHHVVTDLANRSSGITYLVTGMQAALEESGVHCHIHSLLPEPSGVHHDGATYYAAWSNPRSLGVSPPMRMGLRAAAADADIMHAHGVWRMPNVYPTGAVRGTDCELVYSPNGMLEPWALGWSRRRKAIFWRTLQKRAIEGARCLHATSEQEAMNLRRLGLKLPIAIIPIGVDLPELTLDRSEGEDRVLLFFSRLHPKKNAEALLAAWAQLQDQFPQWRLDIAGGGTHTYAEQLRSQARQDDLQRVTFLGEQLGRDKAAMYEAADLFVLPTHSENFGIVIAEALSYGLPVVTTTGTPWSGLQSTGSGWWIDGGVNSLAAALGEAMSMEASALREMGASGRSWIDSDFSWAHVGELMTETYRWVSGGGPTPSSILS